MSRIAKNQMERIIAANDKLIHETSGSTGVLARLFRTMLGNLNITLPRWGQLMTDFIEDASAGIPNNKRDQTSIRGNITKELSRRKMTWKVFCKALRFMQIEKIQLVIEAHHPGGRKTLHSTTVNFGTRQELDKFLQALGPIDEPEGDDDTSDSDNDPPVV